MSTNQTPAIFSQSLPAFLAGKSREELASVNEAAATGTGGTGRSINRISLKQSRFRLIIGGEEKLVVQQTFLDVVIVRANDGLNKAFYLKDWNPNDEPQAPDCYSEDGVRPAADAKSKQCETCAACPQNQWGSKINAVTKNKIKACADSKGIAVAPPSALQADLYQLKVPAASMKDFGAYMKLLTTAQTPVPYYAVVTRVEFDTSVSYPKLKFSPVRYLTEAEYAIVEDRYDSDDALEVCGAGTAGLPPQPAPAQAQPVNVQASPSQPAAQPTPAPTPAPTVDPFAAAQPAAAQAAPAQDPVQEPPVAQRRRRQAAARPEAAQAAPAPTPAADPFAAAADPGNPFAAAPGVQQQQAAPAAGGGATIDNASGEVISGDAVDDIFGAAGWPT